MYFYILSKYLATVTFIFKYLVNSIITKFANQIINHDLTN